MTPIAPITAVTSAVYTGAPALGICTAIPSWMDGLQHDADTRTALQFAADAVHADEFRTWTKERQCRHVAELWRQRIGRILQDERAVMQRPAPRAMIGRN